MKRIRNSCDRGPLCSRLYLVTCFSGLNCGCPSRRNKRSGRKRRQRAGLTTLEHFVLTCTDHASQYKAAGISSILLANRPWTNQADIYLSQVFGLQFKKRAPRAIKEIRKFAEKAMVRPFAPLPPSISLCSPLHLYLLIPPIFLSFANNIYLSACSSILFCPSLLLSFFLFPFPSFFFLSTSSFTHPTEPTPRARTTSASTRSSTKKSGSAASRAYRTGCACASRASATTRRTQRRSCTRTCRRSMSRIQRDCRRLLWRMRRGEEMGGKGKGGGDACIELLCPIQFQRFDVIDESMR